MIDYITELDLENKDNKLFSYYSSIISSITTTMRVVNYCQICGVNSECRSYKCIDFNIYSCAYHPLYSSVLLCDTCYNNNKVKETLKIMFCLVENLYIKWNINKTEKITIKRSSGIIENDWKIEKSIPLKLYEKNNKYNIKLFCIKEDESLTKWILYSELIELNNDIILSILSPDIKYIENDLLKRIFKKKYEEFNKLKINLYLNSKSSNFNKIMNYISHYLFIYFK